VRHRKRGFSLLELLIVIGVMMVLMAMAVISYNLISRSVASRQTRTTLENLKAMLDELNAEAGPDALPTYNNGAAIGYNPNASPAINTAANTIGDVTAGGSNDRYGNNTGTGSTIVVQTQAAMATLMRSPKNLQALSEIPAKLILKDVNNNPYPLSTGPVLLDGWGDPIIYVPAGGIWVWTTNGSTATAVLIKSRDGRPFFASAGPDGDFGAWSGVAGSSPNVTSTPTTPTRGDDNVYSTEN
jgi:type II secretory pathway pseudopilin PulG